MSGTAIKNHAGFIWSVADLLRGVYKQSEYGRVILPLTVLRRLDCVLEPTKAEVLETMADLPETLRNREPLLQQVAGQPFVNTSKHTFGTLLADSNRVAGNLRNYIAGFSESARDIVDKFNFDVQIDRLDDHNLLYLVVSKFAEIDLSPAAVSNLEMGYLYEELIRRFSELSNETAGEHFTPREVIKLMVNLLFADDDELLTRPGVVKTLLDPACGTGGMLAVAEDYLRELNPQARLAVFGQEVNAETYATCRADMLIKGADADIRFGNSFDDDQHPGQRFDYLLANPPFGVEWKMVADTVRDEHAAQGFAGRFGAGLPRINDGSFLFLQHMISKMKRPDEGGARLAIVFNGSPLFTGAAGSGESEIRRWIIESDMLEAVVALPDQLFYNTGISTYFWVVTNRKAPRRRGKVQLIDARDSFTKMRKSLGQKRKEVSAEQIVDLTGLYGAFEEGPRVKIFPNESFGFLRITVERPLQLRWEITDDTLAAVEAHKAVARLDAVSRQALVDALRDRKDEHHASGETIRAVARAALLKAGTNSAAALKATVEALSIRDPATPVIVDRAGNPKPDPSLTRPRERPPARGERRLRARPNRPDSRTIQYRTAVDDYLETEVHPYVPDAWDDPTKTKIGYEIPPNPPLLHLHPTPPPPRNRRRDHAARDGDTGSTHRGRRMTWSEVPLRSLYQRVEESGRPDLPLLSVYRDYGVIPREGREDNYNKPSADLSRYKIVLEGDLVINKMKAWQGSLGVSDYEGIVSPAYFVGRPIGNTDHRFVHHLLRSSPLIAEYGARSKGIRPSQWDLPWDKFAAIKIRIPTPDTQRKLANYLDTETARIDALISKKRHLIKLLDERRSQLCERGCDNRP